MTENAPTRRGFLGAAAGALAGCFAPAPGFSASLNPRVLGFNHTHTGEAAAIEYWRAGDYAPEGLGAINRLLRDFRTGDVHPIDPALLDLLHDIKTLTGTRSPFEIISAYRSPGTNAALKSLRGGVAKNSLHLSGRAIDMRRAAISVGRGGVSYYAGSNFVHVDTGRVRTW
jgi:uncharacterized protein YcbK (DUF882 family)